MSVEVRCPNCGTGRTIKGTEERVRCANKETCGCRFYVEKNIVPSNKEKGDNIGTPESRKTTPVLPDSVSITIPKLTFLAMSNYAINTIRNKKQVVDKDVNSTWYQYFEAWCEIRTAVQLLKKNEITLS